MSTEVKCPFAHNAGRGMSGRGEIDPEHLLRQQIFRHHRRRRGGIGDMFDSEVDRAQTEDDPGGALEHLSAQRSNITDECVSQQTTHRDRELFGQPAPCHRHRWRR